MLKSIRRYQNRLEKNFSQKYKRYLFSKIDFDYKMIALFGARGVGKTTMLFQYMKELKKRGKNVLYISLDYPFLSGVDLISLVEEFVERGGEYLLLDEVHRFENFSANLKSIYDLFDIKVVFTSSSATSILNAKSDLSRRVNLYHLSGFSFREFLEVKYSLRLKSYELEDIFSFHKEIINKLKLEKIDILKEFKVYLKSGYYPFYLDNPSLYYQNLLNTINLTIDLDLTSLGLIEQKYTYKLKKLLETVCESEPFEVNYSRIASMAEISRVKLYDYITYLNDGEMLLLVDEAVKGVKKVQKPAKIYLNNTNLLYANTIKPKIGTIRETFFANQVSQNYKLNIAKSGDFAIEDKFLVEIGGKSKGFNQIKDIKNSFLAIDDISVGNKNKIPLWIFGFLY